MSAAGQELSGVYRQAWDAIVAGVEADGLDPRLFQGIVENTLAVLGPASERRDEWRGNLVSLRSQASQPGGERLAALLDAVIGLLDAGGQSAGLGAGLQGVYMRTWQAIVQGLS